MSVPFVVISDFDGTITTSDLVVELTTRVDEANREVVNQVNRRELDLHAGLDTMFSRLPSSDRQLYEEYLRHLARFRSGYHRFRTVLDESKIPFYIVSNGLDFMLDAVLGSEPEPTGTRRIANKARFDGDVITIDWQYPCQDPCPGGCGLCKHAVVKELRRRHGAPIVYIGDGITDLNGAKAANRVYARGLLAQLLEEDGRDYTLFETFDDILTDLFTITEVLHHD